MKSVGLLFWQLMETFINETWRSSPLGLGLNTGNWHPVICCESSAKSGPVSWKTCLQDPGILIKYLHVRLCALVWSYTEKYRMHWNEEAISKRHRCFLGTGLNLNSSYCSKITLSTFHLQQFIPLTFDALYTFQTHKTERYGKLQSSIQ